jgi:hypothetical protein
MWKDNYWEQAQCISQFFLKKKIVERLF